MSRDCKSVVDRILEEAQQTGKFSNLPTGRPLKLDDDPHTPDDLKLAHKILKEHDLAPEWILLGQDIDAQQARLLDNMRRGARAYQGALADADRSTTPYEKRQRAESTWRLAKESYQKAAAKLNSEILRYNLKVPPGIPHKALFRLETELTRILG